MKTFVLTLSISLFSAICFSQIVFEKGYFINDNNEMVECLIKNTDWRNNPAEFIYRLSETSEDQTADIQFVKEFGIYNTSKYIKATVKIDRSGEDLSELSLERNPVFREEELFLNVLVEGQATLFLFEDKNLTRFFYSTNDSVITQLVYKIYSLEDRKIGTNYQFRQQLFTDLNCQAIPIAEIETLDYYENELVRYFVKYNECQNAVFTNYKVKHSKDFFNLNIRPGLNISSLYIDNSISNAQDADFGTELTFRAGVEFEFIMPFNKNKWAMMIEPTYQYFIAEEESSGINDQEVKVDYKSIELPFGIRHYLFLGEKSQIFIDAAYVIDLSINSTIKYELGWEFDINSIGNLAFGLGYKYNDFALELRYQTSRQVVINYALWDSGYKTISIVFGYSIF